jgi:TonB family protein
VHIQVPVVFTVNNDSNNGGDTRNEPDLGPGETVVDVSKVTVQPVAVFQVRPIYPASLRARNISGRTLIYFIVKKNGGVSNVRAVSATDPLFGMAGVAAVRKWRFHPARQEDHPVNCQLEVPLVFSVNP